MLSLFDLSIETNWFAYVELLGVKNTTLFGPMLVSFVIYWTHAFAMLAFEFGLPRSFTLRFRVQHNTPNSLSDPVFRYIFLIRHADTCIVFCMSCMYFNRTNEVFCVFR